MAPTPEDDDGRADVSCPVCKELFLPPRIPKMLPCSHTVCIKCLEKIREACMSLRCPLCMKSHAHTGGINTLPTNLAVQNFADKYNKAAIKKGGENKESRSSNGVFQIFVKTLEEKVITLDVTETTTVKGIKLMIHQRENVLPSNQRIIFKGKTITKMDDHTMKTCGITKDAVLHLMRRMQGGGA